MTRRIFVRSSLGLSMLLALLAAEAGELDGAASSAAGASRQRHS